MFIDVIIVILLAIAYVMFKTSSGLFITSLILFFGTSIFMTIKPHDCCLDFCLDLSYAFLKVSFRLAVISILCSVVVIILNSIQF